jgi:excisionase family DNA binding protein
LFFDVEGCLMFIYIAKTKVEGGNMETYTPEEAAKALKVNVQTLRKWLRMGEITGANTPAGWRLTPDDLEAWMNKHRKTRQPEAIQ